MDITFTLPQQIGICIVSATALSYVAKLTRQPLLLAYIAAGVLVGPLGRGWVHDPKAIESLNELGLAFLLFIVGLEIDINKLLAAGRTAAIVTAVQTTGSGLLGWVAAEAMGFHGLPAAYIGAAVAFSSTMIVVKLLSDRMEIDTLPGRVTLGIMLLQDVVAIVVLAVQPNLGRAGHTGEVVFVMFLAALKALGLMSGVLLVSRYALPYLFRWVAKSPEILLLSAISWCFLVCYAATRLEFSTAMGALTAGISISALPYKLDVVTKIQSLRDFFVTLFFVTLGMLLEMPTWGILIMVALLTVVVIVSRFLTVWPMLRLLGYDNRVGILSSIHTGQISEFSLVIVMLGVAGFKTVEGGVSVVKPQIGSDVRSLVLILLIVTCTISTYLIQFSHQIAARLVKQAANAGLGDAMVRQPAEPETGHKHAAAPVMMVGCFRIGSSLVHELHAAGHAFSVIDFNPQVHTALAALKVPSVYGDISHMDTLTHAGVEAADVLVASVPDDFLRGTDNARLLESLRKINPKAKIIVTAESIVHALTLYEKGADYVLVQRVLAAQDVLRAVRAADAGDLPRLREEAIALLKARNEVLP